MQIRFVRMVAFIGFLPIAPATMAEALDQCIAIVGTGSVGGALGQRWGLAGERIVYGSRGPTDARVQELVRVSGQRARATSPASAAAACSIALLAVPWEAVEESARALGNLSGKIVIDVTNPLDVVNGRVIEISVAGSGAQQIQSWLPGSIVVKAFNTVNYSVMKNPSIVAGPVSVPLSGDDALAKAKVASLVRLVGLEPIDVGPLATARHTEHMALLYVGMSLRGNAYEYHFRSRSIR